MEIGITESRVICFLCLLRITNLIHSFRYPVIVQADWIQKKNFKPESQTSIHTKVNTETQYLYIIQT